ncbi:hypothetical protein [Helicobacter pylori]|nr:hypothetical protein [Helicobacter pylori]
MYHSHNDQFTPPNYAPYNNAFQNNSELKQRFNSCAFILKTTS